MEICNVSTALKVGKVVLNTSKSKSNLKVEWEDLPATILKSNAGRVYLLVVDGLIKKIGGSVGKGGIKTTMSFYVSGNTGRPSIRSFGINTLIHEALGDGKDVEVYIIQSEQVLAPVKGLFGTERSLVSAFKEMEDKCLSDYVAFTGSYPDWNYQEQAKPWEQYIQEGHAQIMTRTASKNENSDQIRRR